MQYLPPPIILGRFKIQKVEINFKELRLVRNEVGSINLRIQPPLLAAGSTIDEVVINLGSLTYTDLSSGHPVQKTFDLGLNKAVYRNVKGAAGIMEIVNWEVLKRTGVETEQKSKPAPPEMKPAPEPAVAAKPVIPGAIAPVPPMESKPAAKPEAASSQASAPSTAQTTT